jgi:hypothetical protein
MDKKLLQERYLYNFVPEVMLISTLLMLIIVINIVGNIPLYGYKTSSIFDIWSFEHVASGIFISSFTISFRNKFQHPLALTILISFIWETIEHYIETVGPDFLVLWFGGVEHWSNRILADGLMITVGFLLVKAFPSCRLPARGFSLIFIIFHIYVGDSMYFH